MQALSFVTRGVVGAPRHAVLRDLVKGDVGIAGECCILFEHGAPQPISRPGGSRFQLGWHITHLAPPDENQSPDGRDLRAYGVCRVNEGVRGLWG